MISVFLDHDTIKSARRVLLTVSFLTLMMAGVSIAGEGMQILGLTVSLDEARLLGTFRILTVYFLWVFIWLNLAHSANGIREFVTNLINTRVKEAEDKAHSVDVDPYEFERDQWDADTEPDPWWMHFYDYRAQMEKLQFRIDKLLKYLLVLSVLAIEYLPPIGLSLCAVLAPSETNQWVFSFFNSPKTSPVEFLQLDPTICFPHSNYGCN